MRTALLPAALLPTAPANRSLARCSPLLLTTHLLTAAANHSPAHRSCSPLLCVQCYVPMLTAVL